MKKSYNRAPLTPEQIQAQNRVFREEVETYSFLYRCSDCVHVDPATLACSLGYPNGELARGEVRALDEDGQFLFCKDFELQDG